MSKIKRKSPESLTKNTQFCELLCLENHCKFCEKLCTTKLFLSCVKKQCVRALVIGSPGTDVNAMSEQAQSWQLCPALTFIHQQSYNLR